MIKDIIVYEDDNIIVCNKPVGMPSQSDRTFEQDLVSYVLTHRTEQNEPAYAAIINRLDKPVGGLVLFAKNKKTAAGLSAVSGEHGIEKNYYALVKGSPCDKGEFTDYLLKDGKNNISTVTGKDTKGSKKAVLLYEKLGEKIIDGEKYSLMRVRLLTGRHHQIRVQFSHHGYPLYGDIKYNSDFRNRRDVSPALFAYHLSFKNPVGADRITVEAEPESEIFRL